MAYAKILVDAKNELESKGYDVDGICFGFVKSHTPVHYVKLENFVTIPECDVPHGFDRVYHVEYADGDNPGYYLTKTDPSEELYTTFFAIIYPIE